MRASEAGVGFLFGATLKRVTVCRVLERFSESNYRGISDRLIVS